MDLRKHGLERYVDSPHFKVLLAAVTIVDEEDEGEFHSYVIDFVAEENPVDMLAGMLEGRLVVAHNAMFELQVLHKLGLHLPPALMVDSAVVARVAGAGGSLEAAGPQLLGIDKLESGKQGIMLFSIPGTYQMESDWPGFDPKVVEDHPEEWHEFKRYCAIDSSISLKLVLELSPAVDDNEMVYSAVTTEMNSQGWKVDMPLVREMERRYLENVETEVAGFRRRNDADELNLYSTQQLIAWCEERGIRPVSFDKTHVQAMRKRIEKRLDVLSEDDPKRGGYLQVLDLLETKTVLGGSTLKKLRTIIDTVGEDDRLYDQYVHAGAGATLRTSSRGVQMQNLKRLNGAGDDMAELMDPDVHWTNGRMADNLRQVFTASDPDGRLIVGDYSAVESRGLAWYAGEEWKLDTYRQGLGVYEMQASKFFGVDYDAVTKDQRTFGKVGELSCGYQAGASAVQGFAEGMGLPLSDGEAKKLVMDFRNANPRTVAFWSALHAALEEAHEVGIATMNIPEGTITMGLSASPSSLRKQVGENLKTLAVKVVVPGNDDPFVMHRYVHGLYRQDGGFYYWKPSERKTGDLWKDTYTDPKTGKQRQYSLYGGKLAGLLTQSLCREIFMNGLSLMHLWTRSTSNVRLVGQFHDEMVLDWTPPESVIDPTLEETEAKLAQVMSHVDLPGFPLACAVKSDYRYTK